MSIINAPLPAALLIKLLDHLLDGELMRLNVVLGGDGLLGKALINHLEHAGEKSISVDIKSGYDLREKALADFPTDAYVWFLAWDVGGAKYIMDESQQIGIIRSNTRLCDMVFSSLSKSKLPFTFISTQMVNYVNAYGVTKRLGEFWAQSIGNGLIARLWNIYDAEEPSKKSHVIPDLVAQGRSGLIKLMTQGLERRQFLHADDCARALLHQRATKQELADITTGEWVPILRIAERIASHFNAIVTTDVKPGYESLVDPTSPLRDWAPRLSLEEGIERVVIKMKANDWV